MIKNIINTFNNIIDRLSSILAFIVLVIFFFILGIMVLTILGIVNFIGYVINKYEKLKIFIGGKDEFRKKD